LRNSFTTILLPSEYKVKPIKISTWNYNSHLISSQFTNLRTDKSQFFSEWKHLYLIDCWLVHICYIHRNQNFNLHYELDKYLLHCYWCIVFIDSLLSVHAESP
jgi:hypothetical protein